MIRKSQFRMLECLQEQNAVTDNCKTDEDYQKYGMTATTLSQTGINKTQLVEYLPKLKIQQLVISKEFKTKGRPGIFYAITPIGSLFLFKEKIKDSSYDEVSKTLETIKDFFPLIKNHWDYLTKHFSLFVYKSMFDSVDRIEMKSRGKHYFSISSTLQKDDNFMSFERTHLLVTTEKETVSNKGYETDKKDDLRDLAESFEVKKDTRSKIEKDIIKMITFQFYYYLIFQPKVILNLTKKTKKHFKNNHDFESVYHRKLVDHAKTFQKYLGVDFSFDDPRKIESEIIKTSETLIDILKEMTKKDRELKRIIDEQKSTMRTMTDSILSIL